MSLEHILVIIHLRCIIEIKLPFAQYSYYNIDNIEGVTVNP